MNRTSIMCWLANKKFMTWCDVTRTKPSYVKKKYDRAIHARAYQPGELVWADACLAWPSQDCTSLPGRSCLRSGHGPKGSFRAPQTTSQWPGEVVVLMDPEPERSVDVVDDDKLLSSYKSEQLLSEASDVSFPSRGLHWMDTRLRTKLRAGDSRMHYQQFDYSTSGTDDELSDVMLPVPPNPVDADQVEPEAPPAASDQSISPARILPQLFSDHERVRSPSPQLSSSDKESSLPGTSASLLTNPSLTNFLSNYPIWPTANSSEVCHR